MALSLEIILINYFFIVSIKIRNLINVKFIPRYKTCLPIIVALTNLFKTLTTFQYFLYSIFFLDLKSESNSNVSNYTTFFIDLQFLDIIFIDI